MSHSLRVSMQKAITCLTLILLVNIVSSAQEKADTIYTYNIAIAGNVKEVSNHEILYTLPNEDVVYRVNKKTVLRISYSHGRKEVFNPKRSDGLIEGSKDWAKVGIAYDLREVSGASKVGTITVKAT